MDVDVLKEVQQLIDEKNKENPDNKLELSGSLKDALSALNQSLDNFGHSYGHLKDHASEFDEMELGLKFNDLRKKIKDSVDSVLY